MEGVPRAAVVALIEGGRGGETKAERFSIFRGQGLLGKKIPVTFMD